MRKSVSFQLASSLSIDLTINNTAMAETLLKNNRRAVSGLVVLWGTIASVAALLGWWAAATSSTIIAWPSFLLAVLALVLMIRAHLWGRCPRISLTDEHLTVMVAGFREVSLPLDAVECFFIGQGIGTHVQQTREGSKVANVTVVVRLAQRAKEWHEQPMEPSLGKWADGYITVHGLWCEPIDGDFVNAMNHRLAEVKRQKRQPAK